MAATADTRSVTQRTLDLLRDDWTREVRCELEIEKAVSAGFERQRDEAEELLGHVAARAHKADVAATLLRDALRTFVDRVETDRREPDKLFCHVLTARRAITDSEAS